MRLPLNKVSAIQRVATAFSKLEQEHERAPTAEELSVLLETNKDSVMDLMTYAQKQVSVDAPFVEGEENSLISVLPNTDSISPATKLMHESLCSDIERLLVTLKPREAEVLRLSFGLNASPPQTLDEIALNLGLTRERIRQIKEKSLRILRKKSTSKLLQNYL